MTYQVFYSDQVKTHIAEHVDWLRAEHVSEFIIERWYEELFERIDELAQWPKRYPIAEEESEKTNDLIRKMNHQRYLVMYRIDEEQERVEILKFEHGALRNPID